MGAKLPGLTALRVKNAKPGRHGDGKGLYLLVSPSGARSWLLRVQANKRRRDIGLGSADDISLAEARDKAAALRKIARAGGDPIAERDKAKVVIPSFREAAEACHKARKDGWGDRHAKAFLSTLALHVFPSMGRLRVDSVDEKDIVAALSPLWRDKPAAARKLRQRINTVLDYAKGSGWRSTGAPRDGLRPLLSKQQKAGNFASMPYAEVPAFVVALREKPESMGRLALLFTLLTAARSGETRFTVWSHIDFDARDWNRSPELMKNGEAHTVTLSSAALAVLKRTRTLCTTKADTLVFPGSRGRPLSDMTLSKALGVHDATATVHGFRSSFRTWAAEQMPHIPDAVAEAAIAHVVPDAVVRAYKRAKFIEMRRELLEAWGRYCCSQLGETPLVWGKTD